MDDNDKRIPLTGSLWRGNTEYIIEKEQGRGTSCIVYNAKNADSGGKVIIKELYPRNSNVVREGQKLIWKGDEAGERRAADIKLFKDNFDNVNTLKSKAGLTNFMPSAIDFFENETTKSAYLITAVNEGKTYDEFLSGGEKSIFDIVFPTYLLCQVIRVFHELDLIYVDLKPDNFMVLPFPNNKAKAHSIIIFDVDSVRDKEPHGPVRNVGNPNFSAPEYMSRTETLDEQSDVYGIGAVLFYGLMGRVPQEKDYILQRYSFDEETVPDCVKAAGAGIKDDLKNILSHTVESYKGGRYGTAKELAQALETLLGDIHLSEIEKSRYDEVVNSLEEIKTNLENLLIGQKETFHLVSDVKEMVKEILASKNGPDFYAQEESLPISNNRFKYNSNSTNLHGREAELQYLIDMCESDQQFCWVGICGAGGTGKSRLAYELCSKMIKLPWKVFSPMRFNSYAQKEIHEALNNKKQNILICLDYIKQDKDDIAVFIKQIIDNLYINNDRKIRIVLIERESKDVQMDDYSYDIDRYKFPRSCGDDDNTGIINLETLPENAIREIVTDYIVRQNPSIIVDEKNLGLIIKTLGSIDREYRRPLYALFIADAFINNEDLTKWDRNDALKYLLGREMQRLSSLVGAPDNHLNKIERDNYLKTIKYLYALATYQGSIDISDYYEIIRRFCIREDDTMLIQLMKEFGILTDERVVEGWEPDLIGEYFCIDFLNKCFEENGLSDVKNFVDLVADNNLSAYIRYSDMIYKDYPDVVCDCEWMEAIRNIEFPAKFNFVRKNQFRECLFLKNISFPEQMNTIQIGAFRDCKNLERVVFPASLEIIDKYAFCGCEGLVEAVPEDGKGKNPSIIRIDSFAFKDCISLEKVIIPDSIQEMGVSAFENCRSLTDMAIPGKIKKLESCIFAGCKSLRRVNFDKTNNISLADSCFSGCEQLTNIKGYSRISTIDRDAFRNCTSIETLKFTKLKSLKGNVFSGCRSLKYVDLSECEIDHIPERLFFDCESLLKVVLPEDIESVDDRSFYGCKSLEGVDFGNNLATIGRYAFGGCEKLKTLVFPATLRTVKSHAFENCSGLSAISFASKPKTIEDHAFSGCEELSFSEISGLGNVGKIEFCGFTFASFSISEFEFVKTYSDTENVVIPDTVQVIGNDAFLGARDDSGAFVNETVKTVVLPPSVEKIGNRAFMGCVNLRSVNCKNNSQLQIGSSAFLGCTSLQNIEGSLPIDEVCDNAFQNCSSLEKISVSGQLNKIGACAFKGCQNLEYINVKSRWMPHYIGVAAFEGCSKLKYPIDPRLNPKSFVLEGFVFKRITSKELEFLGKYMLSEVVDIPDSCIDIAGVEFNKIKGAKKVIIPDSIRKLPKAIFRGCTLLEEVELPIALSCIPSNAFENCKSLKKISFGGQAPNTIPHGVGIGSGAFMGCKELKNIDLPDDLETIKSYTFSACSALTSIRIPDNVRSIGNFAFQACTGLRTLVLPETLTSLGKGAFCRCSGLTEVLNMENTGLTVIANNTFESCQHLETLKLPKGVKVIKGHAFENCHSLQIPRNFLPNGISVIEDAVFQGCYKIAIVRLPKSIRKIGDYTFKNCSSLKEIIIPKDVSYIGQSAFYHCNSLVDIKLPSELSTLGIDAFAYCTAVKKIEMPNGIKELSADLFKGCSSLEEVNVPEHIKEIPADAFKECISLKRICLPENLEVINVGAFRNCISLEVELPDNLKEIRESAFRCCNSIEKIILPKGVSKISSAVFEGCVRLKEVSFEHHIHKVGNYAFLGCVSLEKFPFVLVDDEIGDAAFSNCKSLPSPLFSNGLMRIRPAAFRGCTNIKKLEFPPSMTAIYGASFRDDIKLESVNIPETVKVIKRSAFRDCVELSEVCIDSSEITIESRAFKGCVRLDYIDIPQESTIHVDAFEECPVEIDILENPEIHLRKPADE